MAVEVRTNSQIHKLIFVIDTRSIVERLPMKPLLNQARSQACVSRVAKLFSRNHVVQNLSFFT